MAKLNTGLSVSSQLRSQSNRSRRSLFGRARLAVMEVALCILVPTVGVLIWLHFDKDFRAALLSAQHDSPTPANSVYDMAALDDTTVVSVQTQGQIRLWDLGKQTLSGELQSHLTEVRCVACSGFQRLLAVGSADGSIELWDVDNPEQPMASVSGDKCGLGTLQFSPDGRFLCSAGETAVVSIWEVPTLRRAGQIQIPGSVSSGRCLTFTDDGVNLLVGADEGMVHVWDFATRRHVRTLTVADRRGQPSTIYADSIVQSVLVLPGDRDVVVVTRARGISVWNLTNGRRLKQWNGDTDAVQSATLSADGTLLITGGTAGVVTTWDIASGLRLDATKHHEHIVRAVACNRDGTTTISGDCLGRIRCTNNR